MARRKELQPDPDRLPAGRRVLFTVLALALPLILLGAAEAAMRLAGSGPTYPLFIPNPQHPQYLFANPQVVRRFVAHESQAPPVSIETGFFLREKPDGATRIFVQGGSTAAGFPYGYGASLAGMLEQRLRRTYPTREIEVVSTALSAVNSYALVDFAGEIIERQPDAVLIYAGHNEYLGILGVGSSISVAGSRTLTRLVMSLRHLRIYRWLEHGYARVAGATEPVTRTGDTLMARVAAKRSIPMDSSLFKAGVRQFRGNLDVLLDRYADAGIPVFLGTLASNERDQSPFASEEGSDSANDWYERGIGLVQSGDVAGARAAFRQAKDRDLLRFRAPEVFNEVIAELADRHQARLVDTRQRLAGASPQGIIGNNLMLEHLHPNLDGYFMLADSFYEALIDTGLLPSPTAPVARATARTEIPVSEVDRLFGEFKIHRITAGWPFHQPVRLPEVSAPAEAKRLAADLAAQRIRWASAIDQLRDYHRRRNDYAEVIRLSLILADAFPFVASLQGQAGQALLLTDRKHQALRYLHMAAALEPNSADRRVELGRGYAAVGMRDEALESLRSALRIDPRHARARRLVDEVQVR